MKFDKVMSITWDMGAQPSPELANSLRSLLMGFVCHLINVQGTLLSHAKAMIRYDVTVST
ncbi:hypothetical protein [Pseudomonas arsenicoxydans]|uniref:Uncharacterized protein n=1 Tax=Pseudomonas arsenicoxydans TaxID=702115 RepID=A0A4P6G0G8_9PSED|nr:hypothetical protein [Pseudomonas arsenicoxydans]QAY84088.1 hypothetical protein CUN61_08860 [Pseudomonas arsenicoxydans]